MISHPKDVFLIHTKGDEAQRLLAEELIRRLPPHGVEIWTYDDWDWEQSQVDRRKKVFRRHGLQVDPVRLLLRDPKPFVHSGRTLQVDRDILRRMFCESVVVALFEP